MVTGDQTLEDFLERTFILEELYFQCVLALQFFSLLSDIESFLLLEEVVVLIFHFEMTHYPLHRFRIYVFDGLHFVLFSYCLGNYPLVFISTL